ncbi:UbiA family prenyltransferase [Pedobacter sp. AW31-3R]|uniref:UbiA family prenyltransferase n=1 Tax=Pedobacter sp. AW31-3R TaxID=3445781 RepID=UPI003FA0C8B8
MDVNIKKLTRSHEWWDHKITQIFSMGYATALLVDYPLFELIYPGYLIIFFSIVAVAIYASIINDYTDMEIDLACGKSNVMLKISPFMRIVLLLAASGLVCLAAFFIYPDSYSVIFYLLIAVAISMYSFPPFRLKKRGIWGVLSCAAAEHLFPTLFTVSIVFQYSGEAIHPVWLCATGLLSYLYGIRSILWHQFLDRDNDRRSGINTFASKVNPASFGLKAILITLVELGALATVLFMLELSIPVVAFALYLLFIFCRKVFFKSKIITVITPQNSYYQILMLDYYTVFFPLSILIYGAMTQPYGWCMLLVHLLLFYKMLLVTGQDIFYIFRDILVKLRR